MSEARTRYGGVHCITVFALTMEVPANFMAPVGRAVVSIAQRGFEKLICLKVRFERLVELSLPNLDVSKAVDKNSSPENSLRLAANTLKMVNTNLRLDTSSQSLIFGERTSVAS